MRRSGWLGYMLANSYDKQYNEYILYFTKGGVFMSEDFTDKIIIDAVRDVLKDKIKDGMSEKEMDEFFSKESFGKKYADIINMIADDSVKTIEAIMFEKVLEERANTDEFIARQNQKWGKAFVASEAMYICILESAEEYNEFVSERYKDEKSYLYLVLRYIHGRAMQIYLEILCLNKNGFADAAYARWRSLYELSITSAFIKRYGEVVAKAFLQSADTEDRYEWARQADCFKNSKAKYIKFADIQKNCELATVEWKKEYTFVNQLVHASPQGTMYRLGSKTNDVLLVGRSDWGMSISAMHSAISLAQITSDFFSVFHHGDSLAALLTFHKWVEKIVAYYKEVEVNCFDDEENATEE